MSDSRATRASISESWKTVRIIEAQIATNTAGTIFSFIPRATGFARIPESLLLLFAVSVLEDALRCLCHEGAFTSRRKELAALMQASKNAIPWQDFERIDQVRTRRNQVAHQRVFLETGQCKSDLAAIARELIAWGVLPTDFRGSYTFTRG